MKKIKMTKREGLLFFVPFMLFLFTAVSFLFEVYSFVWISYALIQVPLFKIFIKYFVEWTDD